MTTQRLSEIPQADRKRLVAAFEDCKPVVAIRRAAGVSCF